jgi:hypothetical protein
MADDRLGLVGRLSRYAIVIILLFAFAGAATYAVVSDNSIHGLTVRFYNVSWAYSCGSTNPSLTYAFGSVVVYSSNSLTTSLSHVLFLMSTNGIEVGNRTVADSSFGSGQSASYDTVQFSNAALNPQSQPTNSLIALTINAQVAAGLYSSQASASYSEVVHFPSLSC